MGRCLSRGVLLLLLGGCLPEITLPVCEVVSDCPKCEGWASCRDGFCFRFGESAGWDSLECGNLCRDLAEINAVDGCCPGAASDAERDPDCSGPVVEVLGAERLSEAAVFGDTVVVVRADLTGVAAVVRLEGSGIVSDISLGFSVGVDEAMPRPVIVGAGDVLVASASGICRVGASQVVWACDRGAGASVAPVVAQGDRLLVTVGTQILVLGADGDVAQSLEIGSGVTSVVTRGSRFYVATASGVLMAFELGADEPAWSSADFAVTTGLAIDHEGRLLFGDADQRLTLAADEGPTVGLVGRALPASVGSGFTVDGAGHGAAFGPDGALTLFAVGPSPAVSPAPAPTVSVTAQGLWTETGRVYFVGADSVLAYQSTGTGFDLAFGYALPGARSVTPNLTASGHLVVVRDHDVAFVDIQASGLTAGWPHPHGSARGDGAGRL